MKHILLFAITALSVLAANAQDIDEDVLPSDRDHWTVTVTYDASIPGNGSWQTVHSKCSSLAAE